MNAISSDYVEVSELEAMSEPHTEAWMDPSIPVKQLALTDSELRQWRNGVRLAPFDALTAVLVGHSGSVLEIGCGVGHCAEIIASAGDFAYTGVDYSPEFIRFAKQRRGWFKFEVMDALLLDYPDKQFDIAISSCCILHIIDWRTALKESCRVARSTVILHRTPVSEQHTRYFFKKAYGVQCVEIHFNREEILAEMELHGFRLTHSAVINEEQKTLRFERQLFHHPV